MDFFARQAAARNQTRWLVLGFIVALVIVVAALDAVVFAVLETSETDTVGFAPLSFASRNPGAALFCTLIFLGVIGLASLYKSLQLRAGGGVVARSLGGVRVERDTTDLKRKRLHNVVEEMAIASSVPMPEVYVLEQEDAINAFAAGHTPANAAVAVTQGALDRLNRDELQGVIAHEFSHILNGDMRLNVQLMGWLFGLLVIALIGRMILRVSPRSRKGAGAIVAIALAMVVLGYIGLLAGRILQAAVSRQRERLADASAVQFTRNPDGLKHALIQIAGWPQGSKLSAADAEQVAHMLFASGLSRVFATHPSIIDRIRTLDPRFNADDLPRLAAKAKQATPEVDEEIALAMNQLAQRASQLTPTPVSAAAPREIVSQVGHPETVHVRHARALRLSLPESLREFVESSGKARSLVLALLLSRAPSVREKQMRLMAETVAQSELTSVQQAAAMTTSLAPMLRLPALQQLFPVLRRLPLEQRQGLARLVHQLIHVDAQIEVFELCLAKLLETLLIDEIEARAPHGKLSLAEAQKPIHVLFSVLARAGAKDDPTARRAYEAGMQSVFPMHRPPYVAYPDWPKRLDTAFSDLEKLQLFAKQAVIEGLVRCISHDEQLSVSESELLRTTCAVLHCPLPPLLPNLETTAL